MVKESVVVNGLQFSDSQSEIKNHSKLLMFFFNNNVFSDLNITIFIITRKQNLETSPPIPAALIKCFSPLVIM